MAASPYHDSVNAKRGLLWSLVALLVTGVAAVSAGILAASGDGWWIIVAEFIALSGAAIGALVYERCAGFGGRGDILIPLLVFAFCTVFVLGSTYLTVAGVPRVGVVAEISYGQSDSGATHARFHIHDPATGRDLGLLRNPEWRDYLPAERVSVVAGPLGRLAPSGPHLWDPITAAMGVAAGLGLLGTLVAGARPPTAKEYTRGP
jgi:hypothetical protein